jgi:hypothetical protein
MGEEMPEGIQYSSAEGSLLTDGDINCFLMYCIRSSEQSNRDAVVAVHESIFLLLLIFLIHCKSKALHSIDL